MPLLTQFGLGMWRDVYRLLIEDPDDVTGGGEPDPEPLPVPPITTYTYSDHDMQCPGDWENGFKEGRVMRFGDGERMLSQLRTGDWQGSTFGLTISDFDRSIRERLNSPTKRYWSDALTIRITDRPTRAAKGTPYTVFVGPIIDARPVPPLAFDLTLGDIVSQGLLSDQAQLPWRRVGDGFLEQLTQVASGLDLDTPEPIIYGIHIRHPDGAASGQGLRYKPIYLGILTIGIDYHVWLVAGHACADITEWFVNDAPATGDEGSEWWVPHWPAWLDLFPDAAFADFRSDVFENDRRYTLILGKVTDPTFLDPEATPPDEGDVTDPDACAHGDKTLTVSIYGIEPNGDGSGDVITDRLLQYKHFAINYIANQGQNSYQSGPWLTNPEWTVFGATVPIIEEESFDAARDISLLRFPGDGYTGAGIIDDRRTLRDWIAAWNRSCSVRFGITNLGQVRIVMLHPTTAIKAAAPLIDETNAILRESFNTDVLWAEHANRIPFRFDFDRVSGEWLGVRSADDGTSITGYGRIITGETRDFPFAPGIVNAEHLATIELRQTRFPPRRVTLETALGPLTTMDLGDYVRFRHFASVGASAPEERLGWIERHQVQAGKRRVQVDLLDVEDLIGFDQEVEAEVPTNDTCATAIDIVLDAENHFYGSYDVSANATDPSVSTSPPLFPGPGVAYHAAWFKFTAPPPPPDPPDSPDLGNFSFVTTASNYDTQLVFLLGTCGGEWTLARYNDNNGPLFTSGATWDMSAGQEIYILVCGYGPDAGASLHLQVTVTWAPALPPTVEEPPV